MLIPRHRLRLDDPNIGTQGEDLSYHTLVRSGKLVPWRVVPNLLSDVDVDLPNTPDIMYGHPDNPHTITKVQVHLNSSPLDIHNKEMPILWHNGVQSLLLPQVESSPYYTQLHIFPRSSHNFFHPSNRQARNDVYNTMDAILGGHSLAHQNPSPIVDYLNDLDPREKEELIESNVPRRSKHDLTNLLANRVLNAIEKSQIQGEIVDHLGHDILAEHLKTHFGE